MATEFEESTWEQVPHNLSHIKKRVKHVIDNANATEQPIPQRDIEAMTIALSEAENLVRVQGFANIPHDLHDRELITCLNKFGDYIANNLVNDPLLGCLLRGHHNQPENNKDEITASDVSWSLLRFSPSLFFFGNKKAKKKTDQDTRGFADAQFKAHFLPWINSLALNISRVRAAYRTWILIYIQTIKAEQSVEKIRRAASVIKNQEFVHQVDQVLTLFGQGLYSLRHTLDELARRDVLNRPIQEELRNTVVTTLGQLSALFAVTEDPYDDLSGLVKQEQEAIQLEVTRFTQECSACQSALAHVVWKCCLSQSCLGCLNLHLSKGDTGCIFCRRVVKVTARAWAVVPVMSRILKRCLCHAGFWEDDGKEESRDNLATSGICTLSTASMCTVSDWDAESESIVAAVLDSALRD